MAYQYLLCGPVLKITCSDSIQEHVDGQRIPDVHDHPDGLARFNVLLHNDSKKAVFWRKRLGKELAIKFLLKPKNGMYPIFCTGQPFLITALVDYILAEFPKSYFLYSHKKGNGHDVREDCYLYSLCSHLLRSHSLLTYRYPLQAITSSFALQQNLSPMLPGLLLVCQKVGVGASTAALPKEKTPRQPSMRS